MKDLKNVLMLVAISFITVGGMVACGGDKKESDMAATSRTNCPSCSKCKTCPKC